MRITIILRGVSGATVVATDAGADELYSRKSAVGAGGSGRERRFRDLTVGVVSEIIVVVWE